MGGARGFVLGLLGGALLLVPSEARAWQAEDAERQELVDLFFDCQAPNCRDADYFRRELPFVNWVVDRAVADVQVLVTSIATGGGGRLYTLAFIGLRDFEGDDRELTLALPADATSDDARSGIAGRARLGLVRYAQGTSAAERLRVSYEGGGGGPGGGPSGGPGTVEPSDDPWNFWVFSINGNGFISGEATSSNRNLSVGLEASRTTEEWKYSISASRDEQVLRFDFEDDQGQPQVVEETINDWDVRGLAVRSLGRHWALGMRADAGSSTRVNQDLRWSLRPGVEYDFFPYSESARRSLTLQYLVGPTHFEYADTTIFERKRETQGQQSLTARLSLIQPWGRWTTSVSGRQYLHDPSKYSIDIQGDFNIRLFRGFSIRMFGSYSWIRDQLYLAKSGATEQEVLLRQRQLATSYRYFTSFGIQYRFGSIFNNVVNPRFGDSGFFF